MARANLECTYHLYFILLATVIVPSTVTAASATAALCTIPSPTPKNLPAATGDNDTLELLQSFQLSAGYFAGGEELHFETEEDDEEWSSNVLRSFSLLPHSVDRTDDFSGLLHVAATLTLSGGRARLLQIHGGRAGRRRRSYLGSHTVSFHLNGYYSASTGELCATGAGAYSEDDGAIQPVMDVVFKLHIPTTSSLTDPFVNGMLQGAGFKPISLVAYAEGDSSYRFRGEPAPCAAASSSSPASRGAFHAFGGAKFSCARLREHLVSSFRLRHGGDAVAPSNTSPALPWLGLPLMHVAQVRCAADGGAVRAYVSFSNDTKARGRRAVRMRPSFTVKEEAMVVEGRWEPARNALCLRACRVERRSSEPVSLAVRLHECGVGISFWFPGVWTIRDRSAVAGVIWNSTQQAAGTISATSIDMDIRRSNFSDVKYSYNYTMVEEAKRHYLGSELSSCSTKKTKGSFVAANDTYRDFEFSFYHQEMMYGQGDSYPVSIDSVIVYGDRLAVDDSFLRHVAVVNNTKNELLNVSYEIRHRVPPTGWEPPKNRSSFSIPSEEHHIMAEGVYDPKNGVLCMIGCREFNSSMDCQVLITVQFASLDQKGQGHGRGAISSLRSKTDPLYFEKIDIGLFGMYAVELAGSVSRMDMESAMLAASTTLPCVFTALQILHAKRNPAASAATSVTMLVVLALGYLAPLLVASETLFLSRRTQWVPFQSYVPYELNQAMLRAPTMIALLLQLRLLQLAWSGRKSAAADDQSKWADAERRALYWVCLPLYAAGGALTVIANVVSGRRARHALTVHVGPPPATLWQDLVASAGLALDAFLLPQVAMNVFSAAGGGGAVRAISPWFYVGGTVVRAMPHVYDAIRRQSYAPSARPSYVYAGPRDDRFGLAWDVTLPCVAGLLAAMLFMQQRRAGGFLPRSRSVRRSGGYEMVSSSTPI